MFPKLENNKSTKKLQVENFIKLTMSKYNFEQTIENDRFISWIAYWSEFFDLSLRDIEKSVALYALIYPNNFAYIFTYFIALKTKKKNLFDRLMNNHIDAHTEIKDLLLSRIINQKNPQKNLTFFYEWHNAHCTDFKTIGETFSTHISEFPYWGIDEKDLFNYIGNMINFDIEN